MVHGGSPLRLTRSTEDCRDSKFRDLIKPSFFSIDGAKPGLVTHGLGLNDKKSTWIRKCAYFALPETFFFYLFSVGLISIPRWDPKCHIKPNHEGLKLFGLLIQCLQDLQRLLLHMSVKCCEVAHACLLETSQLPELFLARKIYCNLQ